jgi:tetratricopeptide (TPR) repeat protein
MGETKEERAVLEQLTALSDDDVDALGRLMELCIEQEDWVAALNTADRLLGINPLIAPPHRVIAAAAEKLDDSRRAIPALRALVALNPIDPADLHFRLSRHLTEQSELSAARREVLRSLEEAPRFRAAHRQLLVILDKIAETEKKTATSNSPAVPDPADQPLDAPDKPTKTPAGKADDTPPAKSPPAKSPPAKSPPPSTPPAKSNDEP